MLMPRGIKNVLAAISTLAVIGVALVAMNEPLRQGLGRFSGHIGDLRSLGPVAALSDAVTNAVSLVGSFSDDNTLLFAFLVVAVALVVLMLRT
jgi:hypothetical protein